jgi:hypothetical protein
VGEVRDWPAEFAAVDRIDLAARAAYDEGIHRAFRGEITRHQLANIQEREVLPRLQECITRIQGWTDIPDSLREVMDLTRQSLAAWYQSVYLEIHAHRTGDLESERKAREMRQTAEELKHKAKMKLSRSRS